MPNLVFIVTRATNLRYQIIEAIIIGVPIRRKIHVKIIASKGTAKI